MKKDKYTLIMMVHGTIYKEIQGNLLYCIILGTLWIFKFNADYYIVKNIN